MERLIIIGGGASGLAAAVTAASLGVEGITILEGLPRTGKKILATGNGRCNLSHTPVSPADYRGSVRVEKILEEFGDAASFFETIGIHCRADDQGRVYPYSNTATVVLDALRSACQQSGVQECCGEAVTALTPCRGGWMVRTETQTLRAENVIFAAGGHAAPKLGTDGNAWRLLEALGIPVISPRPVLCPVRSDANALRPLKGLRARAEVSLLDRGRLLRQERGEVQFTQDALSGICLFNLSTLVEPARCGDFSIVLNLCPEQTQNETAAMLYGFQAVRWEADCELLLSGLVQKPLARLVLRRCGIAAAMPASQLDGRQIAEIARTLHGLAFPVMGLSDWSQAQATAGGVHADALDAHLQVKAHPGLYIVGEAVDVHSFCGGYHLHWAWASGARAARHIAL